MATTAMSIDGWFRCSLGALSKTEHCGDLRATYRKTFEERRKVVDMELSVEVVDYDFIFMFLGLDVVLYIWGYL